MRKLFKFWLGINGAFPIWFWQYHSKYCCVHDIWIMFSYATKYDYENIPVSNSGRYIYGYGGKQGFCPICGEETWQEFCDIGVGTTPIEPEHCLSCGWDEGCAYFTENCINYCASAHICFNRLRDGGC